ncbi:hypothetical protein [Mycobacterium sp. ITM-2016-00318]|uniref:hypothetical protein n=1 Tax=Mycobacterium sp. ITM-2016-00318 TaxID=2099693 RepID=UPI000CFA2400|nr:hypothetical protein [Mycobacterium sp. ITM-2016-00318]WNG92992.1 hypothetical protein C6A82_000350 [Mycobacterium sp. ITM-2016-00318]
MIKVDVPGLMAAAQKLLGLATSAQGLLAETAPLAADPTSGGAALRLDTASMALWGAACAQAASLHTAATQLMMVAAKFGTLEEINTYGLTMLEGASKATDDVALATLPPVPPLPPDARVPISPGPPLTGEGFAKLVHKGSAANGAGFSNTSTNNGVAIDTAAMTVREVAAAVPELWESPTGTAALAGRLNEYVTTLNAIADRSFALGDQSRRHADDYSATVLATPKPEEFEQARSQFNQATDPIAKSQAALALGRLESLATAEASRYAGVTDATTGVGTSQAPGVPGPPGVPVAAGAGSAAPAQAASAVGGQAQQVAKSGATEAAETGQGADQLAQMLPQALQSIGGMAGGLAGMAGQVPQQLMQAGQGLAQTAQQGLGGLLGKNATDAELAKKAGDFKAGELSKEGLGGGGTGGGGGGGVGDTHPAGSLGPPVTPSTSHTPPSMPAGAAPPPTTPTASGGSAMGGMPMGMPMGGMMPHGQGGGDGADKVPADKKVVTPPQAHTEPVTGRVPDRTVAAAEASRNRADSKTDSDDDPPRGPIMRRITLAPLNDERS